MTSQVYIPPGFVQSLLSKKILKTRSMNAALRRHCEQTRFSPALMLKCLGTFAP